MTCRRVKLNRSQAVNVHQILTIRYLQAVLWLIARIRMKQNLSVAYMYIEIAYGTKSENAALRNIVFCRHTLQR